MVFTLPAKPPQKGAAGADGATLNIMAPHTHGISLYGDPTPLTSTEAITALWGLWGDGKAVTTASHNIPTWGELRGLNTGERVQLFGARVANIPLPETCPPIPTLPPNWAPLTPNNPTYPQRLNAAEFPLLHVRGDIPTIPAVFVTTKRAPAPRSTEVARSAALTAVSEQLPVITVLHHTSALTIIRTVLSANGQQCVILPHSASQLTPFTGVLDHVVENGGSVITPLTRQTTTADNTKADLELVLSLAVKLSGSAIITDAETPPLYTATAIQHVIANDLPLIMPGTQTYSALAITPGIPLLTQPNGFNPTWYGINSRIEQRLNNKQPAADAVVHDQEQLAWALRKNHQKT